MNLYFLATGPGTFVFMTSLLNLVDYKQVNVVLEISSDLNQVTQLYVYYLEKSSIAYILFVPDPKWDKIRC